MSIILAHIKSLVSPPQTSDRLAASDTICSRRDIPTIKKKTKKQRKNRIKVADFYHENSKHLVLMGDSHSHGHGMSI